jgi:hypothetical protein
LGLGLGEMGLEPIRFRGEKFGKLKEVWIDDVCKYF